jgi:DNA-3-methyladenine glycosylase
MSQIPKVSRFSRTFFARPTLTVARQLLGQRLVCTPRGKSGPRLAGIITEVEAYIGEADLACHARAGRTQRTEVMYGQPGHLYVYFTYGLHWMMNIVTEVEGFPAAVLLRAVEPEEGLEVMRQRRNRADHLTDGPAKLTQAFGIDKGWNGIDLCAPDSPLFIEQCPAPTRSRIVAAPRVGINSTPEPWLTKPWNFSIRSAQFTKTK